MGATPRELLYDRIPFLNRAIGSRRKPSGSANGLLQLGVLRLGFLQDGDVGVGVFPEREEVLICSAGFGASGFCSRTFCGLGFEGVGGGVFLPPPFEVLVSEGVGAGDSQAG